MKYINDFKIFEVYDYGFPKNFILDIKDISNEFSDNDYKVYFNFVEYFKGDDILEAFSIDIGDISGRFFSCADIKNTLIRIETLSSEFGYAVDIEMVEENDFYSLVDFLEIYECDEFYKLGIIIYKKS